MATEIWSGLENSLFQLSQHWSTKNEYHAYTFAYYKYVQTTAKYTHTHHPLLLRFAALFYYVCESSFLFLCLLGILCKCDCANCLWSTKWKKNCYAIKFQVEAENQKTKTCDSKKGKTEKHTHRLFTEVSKKKKATTKHPKPKSTMRALRSMCFSFLFSFLGSFTSFLMFETSIKNFTKHH